jgi:hypothetical protein
MLLYRCKKTARSSPVIAIHLIQDMTSVFGNAFHWIDGMQFLHHYLPSDSSSLVDSSLFNSSLFDSPTLGQLVRETDIVGDIQKWFNQFVKTGQAWAFLLGLIAGYMIKTFTTFG